MRNRRNPNRAYKKLCIFLLALLIAMSPMHPTIAQAAISDNISTAVLEQTVGSWEDTSESHTVIGLLRLIIDKVMAQLGKMEMLETQIAAMDSKVVALDTKLDAQNADIQQKHDDEMTAINNIYRVAASNAFSASQVKSTKAASVSPKQVKLTWNCTQDNDCSTSSASSDALSNWTDIKAFNIYYGTTANAAKMTYYGSVTKSDSKLFYQNYEYTVGGLNPNTTYYFWVTSVMSDDMELEDSSAVRTVTTPTLASAQATGLASAPNGGTALNLTWSGNYSGYVKYKIYCSTSSFTATSSTTAKATTSNKSYTITGLTAGQTYYIAVCAVLNDGTTWVSNVTATKAMTCPAGTFATASSWADVQQIIQLGRANTQGFAVGQSRTVDLSSMGAGTATITLVDMSTDGKELTCMFTAYSGTVPKHAMNSTHTNSGSWSASEVRPWLNGSGFYDKLPSDLRDVIVNATVTTGTSSSSITGGGNQTTTDKLYLAAEKEIWGNRNYSATNESDVLTQFQYFANGGSKALTTRWWLRSPVSGGSSLFCYVYSSQNGGDSPTSSNGIFPVFKIK